MLETGQILTPDVEKLLSLYKELVVKGNRRLNLVARTNTTEIIDTLTSESLFPLSWPICRIESPLIDIGSGAGIPGVPLSLVKRDLCVVLLDSNRRKSLFLKQVVASMQMNDVEVVCDRAENLIDDIVYVGHFRTLVTRATADMGSLLKWGQALLKPRGELIAWKGSRLESELESADLTGWSEPQLKRTENGVILIRLEKLQ